VVRKIVIICGPTCSGKTALGVELALRLGGEVVSADSQQVYRGLDIGTAKPTKKEMRGVPHHLIDVVDPDEGFDAAKYVELADEAIKGIVKRGRVPIVVGGTGLYIRALLYGLAEAPPRDDSIRERHEDLRKKHGVPYLYDMLKRADPDSAEKIKPNDFVRISRALEVFELTGKAIGEFQKGHGFLRPRYDCYKIGLSVERGELYRRINERVDRMIAEGFVEETLGLLKKYGPGCRALMAVGYREIADWHASHRPEPGSHRPEPVEGRPQPSIIDLIKRNTRRYAKRQMTWFRAEKDVRWIVYP
jgi:tRNA dimethylallyltransferase